jgi:hypothetical protein
MQKGLAAKSVVHCALVWLVIASECLGCPLCEALSGTISDDIKGAAFAAIAKVRTSSLDPVSQLYRTTFHATGRLQLGKTPLPPYEQDIEMLLLDPLKREQQCLVLGYSSLGVRDDGEPPATCAHGTTDELAWSTPRPLTEESVDYLLHIPPQADPTARLMYFYDHLRSSDPVVQDDAYNECARTPLSTIRSNSFRKHIDIKDIGDRVANPELSDKSKCFYWMLLAEFGECDQLELFESISIPEIAKQIQPTDHAAALEQPIWIAASIAAYCSLAARCGNNQHGVAKIEHLILGNPKASTSIKYAAISAMRVVSDDLKSLPPERVAQALEYVLQDSRSADFVIADLARWKHWTSLPKLMILFDKEDEDSSLVRVPIINYSRVCPLPEAKAFLDRARLIDPQAYRRAFAVLPPTSMSDLNHDEEPK